MKIALITDTHAGVRNDLNIFNDYFIKFHEEVFFPYLKAHNINTILHLGDVFDRRKYINFQTLNLWRNKIFNYMNENFKTYIILGNHDCYFKSTNTINSLKEILHSYTNITILEETTELNFDNTNILFVPWLNEENIEISLNDIKRTKSQIVCGHFDIIGFETHSPGAINLSNGLLKDVFKRFDCVFSGHYHHKSSQDNIHYLGAPYEMMWSDYGQDKGFHIFDTETRELEFIKNELKIFHKIYYNETTNNKISKKDYSNSIIKIILEEKNNQNEFDYFLSELNSCNPFSVSIVENTDLKGIDDYQIDESKDTLTLLTEYVESIKSINDGHKSLVINLLKDVYKESLNYGD